ncbi:class 3 lipase protein [Aphelenchoides avenae]|nr:class 3 lipase protein [Aphelenchus avenae]
MLPLSAAAYGPDVRGCLAMMQPHFEVKQIYTASCGNSTCLAYTAISKKDKAIIVAFRGSCTLGQVLEEHDDLLNKSAIKLPQGGKVAHYFGTAFNHLWKAGLGKGFAGLLRGHGDYEIWITGHSLGAALASVAASAIATSHTHIRQHIRLITFGEPRVGNVEFARSLESMVQESYRITRSNDIVVNFPSPPNVPGVLFYHHHQHEIYYPGNMTDDIPYVVCDKAEDPRCAAGHNGGGIDLDPHRHYFGINVPQHCRNMSSGG